MMWKDISVVFFLFIYIFSDSFLWKIIAPVSFEYGCMKLFFLSVSHFLHSVLFILECFVIVYTLQCVFCCVCMRIPVCMCWCELFLVTLQSTLRFLTIPMETTNTTSNKGFVLVGNTMYISRQLPKCE